MSTANLRPVEGYDKLAAFIEADPGLAIFRRFTKLNIKSILYYQAEIANLEEDLDFIIQDDKDSQDEKKQLYPFSVRDLKEGNPTQWSKFQEARQLMEKFNHAIIQQRELMRLSTPDKCDLTVLREWLDRPEGGDMFFESAAEMNVYNKRNDSDMIALFSRHEGVDNLTRLIFNRVVPWFHKRWGEKYQRNENGAWQYSDKKIKACTHFFSVIIAAVLPASSMIVLYFIKNTAIRMVTIMLYNIAFSLALGLMVRARRVEIFAAATAFAAVNVALISNSGDCQCS
ncbi:hypothetical protein AAWM_04345 [Aspergillus awamori]|uniref:DUF6594 domain-containing protein n=3 Tax=Aspergillus TaxID=5052 RepID=A0A3F3PPT8_9EURO|nr:hypothetical protein BDQ94DRAFT_174211 [Aspergillus welwitschiae]KAI2832805.1 hypothetical protein CBS133816_1085 [Aspergillus niger]GCB21460.1 hypothetical protein AAWM_04345 [Aspergillus awamori]KAI2878306.1 hypothetical protein CBS11852_10235 [Aspergillus niger]KAI2894105.1 hypothetical protein CBS63078_8945 [Aspergillus niger]KAI2909608.1 hypothetical protein CBS147371_9498 [Aspergillus niger]